jgi:glycosyltransferase involved in cell wall biosynthesis
MTARPTEWITDNAAWSGAAPRLSVLIPFMRDDPTALLAALDRESVPVEVIVLDDGSGDPALATRVGEAVEAMRLPARFIRLAANEGRSRGRNRLARQARADRFLFIDADMLPDSDHFLGDWLALVDRRDPAAAFGGFSLDQTPRTRENALHRAMALRSDCVSAADRARDPAKHMFTANLLVRRDVFDSVSFDERFTGWGWEDVEWAIRVADLWPIVHADIPASHLGLDTAPVMARKYEKSAANFARVVADHRAVVETYPSYRVARLLKHVPMRGLWRPLIKMFALSDALPVASRAFALRLYRAALYAEAV